MSHNIYRIPNGGYVLIESSVWDKLDRYRQKKPSDNESGGILLGFRKSSSLHIIDITNPAEDDVKSRFRFKRQSPAHRNHAHTCWKRSGKTITHLGDWHTHPERNPSPSFIDHCGMQAQAIFNRPEAMLSLILGTRNEWLGLYKSAGKPIKLVPF